MDPLSGAASVLTVIAAALQSGLAIHKAVSGIQNGPEHVSRLASAVEDLNSVLHQLTRVPALSQDGQLDDLSELRKTTDKCVRDVESFNRKLAKLTVVPTDNGSRKAWKQVKTLIRKDAFRDMWQLVLHHISSLTLQLNVLQR